MADSIKIRLDGTKYALPTQEDIRAAKQFILRRNEYARLLEGKVDECLADAAEEITKICYRYNVDPMTFSISSQYNEQMMQEISDVMDEAEADILSLIYEYSTQATDNSDHISQLAAWIATLGRGNRNLQDTLDGYLYKAMKDWEAAIAAMRYAELAMADAVTKIKNYLHGIYTMPEVRSAFNIANDFNATYIRSRGVMAGGVGLSNNGSTNVTNMARITLQMAWMREQGIEFNESGAAGYYVLRGSGYPCSLCDDAVGFHLMTDMSFFPPIHPHCCCYVVPIYPTKEEETTNSTYLKELNKAKESLRESEDMPTSNSLDSFSNLRTQNLLRSDKVLQRLLWHSFTLQEISAAKYIWNNPSGLEFVRESKLGEVKDMTKESDRANINTKKRRKVQNYNVYSFVFQGKRWLIKLEQHKKGFEQFYSFTLE